MDLTEIQDSDVQKIIAAKLAKAQRDQPDLFIVKETSLLLDEMNGLPRPLVKWFLKSISIKGIYNLTTAFQNKKATAQTLIGYADENGTIHFFEGYLRGMAVSPRGINGFGWNALFQSDGDEKIFAKMTTEEKSQCSIRKKAVEYLAQFFMNE